ncbi:ABC transporter ATP-binding protein [Streptomyces fulvorobeus]|uniref:ABC transporter ATP-binding protein n=1 Tax=Streptomyces fulvorobeus TaxID=284028 RepID=A0A7J0BZ47_9ACTN|nr:ABC transporter ATP-binding protein [Streptomyces fulvorobeus]NYE39320.1 oligopeptide/dipeptide ABC transporter ATP-binding protein [Streptomyces fulvorobeus]GFM95539.1 ABC transporter ATP-binding protein [Streptomyces fulvorobeus]
MPSDALLSVRDLSVDFDGVPALSGLSFDVRPGEVLALVGESGAGKSVTARALLGMCPRGAAVSGSVLLRGTPVTAADRGRRIALVPQDALSALSPVLPVDGQLALAVRSVQGLSRRDALARAREALAEVGIPAARVSAYPHELSGGMRQRAVIAMATVNRPELVVADEPTTALDPGTRDKVLGVLGDRCAAAGASLVLVTHDLGAVGAHADRMVVLYAGRPAEYGPVDRILRRPLAPYTEALLACLPTAGTPRKSRLPTLPGRPPAPGALGAGCAFAPRCRYATVRCHTERPAARSVDGREVACHLDHLESV